MLTFFYKIQYWNLSSGSLKLLRMLTDENLKKISKEIKVFILQILVKREVLLVIYISSVGDTLAMLKG